MISNVAVLNLGHSTLGIARALAPMRIPVYAFARRTTDYGAGSRHLKVIPSPDSAEKNGIPLRDFLIDFYKRRNAQTVLFPTRDLDVVFLDKHRTILEQHFLIAQPAHDVLDVIINKTRLIAAAKHFGLSIPRTLQFEPSATTAISIPADFSYPVIIKPIYAHQPREYQIPIGRELTKAHVAHCSSEALSHVRLLTDKGLSVFLQEFIPGDTDRLVICAGYLAKNESYTGAFTARKRLQYPEAAGIGRAVETVDDPKLAEMTLTFLKSIGYHGIFEAEYKRDPIGKLHLIEINPRHWDQHLLGRTCGVDVSTLAIADLMQHNGTTAQAAYRFRHAIWYDDPFIVRLALSRDVRWRALREELKNISPKPLRVNSIFSVPDPLPAVYGYTKLTQSLWSSTRQRLRSRRSR